MVQELNTYIGLKKQRQDEITAKAELIGTSGRKGGLPEKSREGRALCVSRCQCRNNLLYGPALQCSQGGTERLMCLNNDDSP